MGLAARLIAGTTERMRATTGTRSRPPTPLTYDALREIGLRYLDRYDASVGKLRRVLTTRAKTMSAQLEPEQRPDPEQVSEWIEGVLSRYVEVGIVNDARFSEQLASSLRRRGLGKRAIENRLRQRGISTEVAAQAVVNADEGCEDSEYVAACQLVRRRKLGHLRSEERREICRNRDLATLARAGFAWDIARRALEGG